MAKVVTFGELMVHLAPEGYYKLLQTNNFKVNYTGAEANVCVSLSRFGLQTEFVTKIPSHDIAFAALGKLNQYLVGTNNIEIGGDRIGLYYLERGALQRPSKIIYDRKNSAISLTDRNEFSWNSILKEATWFHFTGITAGLSEKTALICLDAIKVCKKQCFC